MFQIRLLIFDLDTYRRIQMLINFVEQISVKNAPWKPTASKNKLLFFFLGVENWNEE